MPENNLGEELFESIQMAQGYAFIADDVLDMSNEQVVDVARKSLAWTIASEKKLREFLRKYGYLSPQKERL